MLSIGLSLVNATTIGEGGPSYSAEASALFAAMTVQPDATRKTLIEDTIAALKAAGVWDDLDAFYVMAAHDAQASRLNWKSPGTYTLTLVATPTFEVDRGWTGDTVGGGRLRTQFTASLNAVQYTLNDASAWLWWTAGLTSNLTDFGDTTSPRTAVQCNSSGTTTSAVINATNFSGFVATGVVPGLIGVQRTTATHQRAFRNGEQIGTDVAEASTSVPASEWYVCGRASQASARQIAASAWGASLTGKEAAFYAAMLTYMQSVGAAA